MPYVSPHVHYPHPLIAEVIAEVHLSPVGAAAPNEAVAGDLFLRLQTDYPKMEPKVEMGIQLKAEGPTLTPSFLPPRQRVWYRHKNRNVIVQLAQNLLVYNVLPAYPGWPQVEKDLTHLLQRALPVLKPGGISRLGLRFINKIPRTKAGEQPGEWLRGSPYVPEIALRSTGGSVARLQTPLDSENGLIVTVADQPAAPGEPYGSIVLDIDRQTTKVVAPEPGPIVERFSSLHEHIWEVFVAAKGDKLENRLIRGGVG